MFLQQLEELKKEVWFLKNKTIKQLLEEVALLTGGQLDSTFTQRITTLEEEVERLENSMTSFEKELAANSDSLSDFGQHLAEVSAIVSSANESIKQINQEIENLHTMDDTLAYVINGWIDELDKVEVNFQEQIDLLSTKVGQCEESLTSAQNDILSLQNRADDIEEDVLALSQTVEGLGGSDLTDLKQDVSLLKTNDNLQDGKIQQLEEGQTSFCQEVDLELSQIKEDISQLQNGGNIDVEEIESRITANEGAISQINTSLGEIEEEIDALNASSADMGQQLDLFSAEQTILKETLQENVQTVAALKEAVEENTDKIAAIELVDEQQNQDIEGNKTDISTLSQTTTNLNNSMSNIEASVSTNSQLISALQAEIETLKSQAGGGGGSSVVEEVIYDMTSEDPAINYGFTSGILGGKYIRPDLAPYSKLRVFFTICKGDQEIEVDLVNRKNYRTGITCAYPSDPRIFLNVSFNITSTKNLFQVLKYTKWTYDTSVPELRVEYETSNSDIYVYKIIGYKNA